MSEENQEHDVTPGAMPWTELISTNKAESINFYSGLFGWTTEEMELPDGTTYTLFKVGERAVAGCVVPDDGSDVPPMWLSYINVENLDVSIAKAKELGGTICKGRVDLPMGSFAVIADPHGAVFSFWQASGECPE